MPRVPRVPEQLHPLAREILVELSRHPESGGVIIGGGVALQHYCEFRSTVDLDAWWARDAEAGAEEAIRDAVARVAKRHGLELAVRQWRETASYELRDPAGGRKRFSFQIALRSVEIDPPLQSAWPPVKIETLRDTIAAKMNALVERGAPRDLLDVYEVCRRGLVTVEDCWRLWRRKRPDIDPESARARVLHHVEALESRRPLSGIADEAERESARAVRDWTKATLCGTERAGRDDGD